jgi:phage-related protein
MPQTDVLIFAEDDGTAPLLDWLDTLPAKAQDKCIVRIERLEELGHELRRPEADLLRNGIYELRTRLQSVNYRMLYFFHEQRAVISHGLRKEKEVPEREIELALKRKCRFESDPDKHTHGE